MKRAIISLLFVFLSVFPSLAQQAEPTGGGTPFHLVAAATNNSTLIAPGQHSLYNVQVSGIGTAPAYLKFYDKATAPTCGTDIPVKVIAIPAAATAANGGVNSVPIPRGAAFFNGLGFCITTGIADSDNTAPPSATFQVNFEWK